MSFTFPVQREVDRDLDVPIPKELGLRSLEGGMYGSQNWKTDSKMAVAKRQRREKPEKVE